VNITSGGKFDRFIPSNPEEMERAVAAKMEKPQLNQQERKK
jgi:hypothetical protein